MDGHLKYPKNPINPPKILTIKSIHSNARFGIYSWIVSKRIPIKIPNTEKLNKSLLLSGIFPELLTPIPHHR